MAKVLLGVTGSVAAIHTRLLFEELQGAGHQVKVVATQSSLYFFNPLELGSPANTQRDRQTVILDEDEWPGIDSGTTYQRGDSVLHIELRRWADAFVIAPLDANTLAKLALGICDNCLTCVYRAWDRTRRIVLAPAMNTLMWEHPATARHLRQIAEDITGEGVPEDRDTLALSAWINDNLSTLKIAKPQSKQLACDDIGIGAMAARDTILSLLNDR